MGSYLLCYVEGLVPFKFNGIVRVCDAASRVRSGVVPFDRRILARAFSAHLRVTQRGVFAIRVGVATPGGGGKAGTSAGAGIAQSRGRESGFRGCARSGRP